MSLARVSRCRYDVMTCTIEPYSLGLNGSCDSGIWLYPCRARYLLITCWSFRIGAKAEL